MKQITNADPIGEIACANFSSCSRSKQQKEEKMNKIELTQEDIRQLLDSNRFEIRGKTCNELIKFFKNK